MRALHARLGRRARAFSTAEWSKLETSAGAIVTALSAKSQTVGVAETTSGGLISAALWSSPAARGTYAGGGVRLAQGISRTADADGVKKARDFAVDTLQAAQWGLVYEDGVERSESGTAVHALELAHAAKLNLGTDWGVGESSVPGPEAHHRSGIPPGMGFVAVAGPTAETTGVLKLDPTDKTRSENMARFATAALDLLAHLQAKS